MGWILETNEPMNRAMEGMGGTVVKRYRIYEKAICSRPRGRNFRGCGRAVARLHRSQDVAPARTSSR